jgi:hypothetical protein
MWNKEFWQVFVSIFLWILKMIFVASIIFAVALMIGIVYTYSAILSFILLIIFISALLAKAVIVMDKTKNDDKEWW